MNSTKRRSPMAGVVAGAAGTAVAALLLTGCSQHDTGGQNDRQDKVAERGRSVMPFDLDQTTHHFTPTDTGGIQEVVADEPGDTEQIGLIRSHLRQEAKAFARGDFGDPARIHGHDMPGLAQLEEGYERLEVRYQKRTDGAALTYHTEDPALAGALHDWFEAQLSDHGDHAEGGH
ncbi:MULTISPECIES: aspartate carbamoyltransferase [Streptomyces]|nr:MULTISPECIES: aspartate carbamoyltransferase [Streptomyces]